MKRYFEYAKVGDRVWDFSARWGTIERIEEDYNYAILVKFDCDEKGSYTLDGKKNYKFEQTLFWDEIKFEVPEKPFVLKDFLKDNLKPKEFEYNCKNGFIYYSHIDKKIRGDFAHCTEEAFLYFQPGNIGYVERILNEEKITMKQLKQAYKELGWL